MPKDVRLPNGTVIKGVPDDATKDQIMAKAIKSGLAKPEDFGQAPAPPPAPEAPVEPGKPQAPPAPAGGSGAQPTGPVMQQEPLSPPSVPATEPVQPTGPEAQVPVFTPGTEQFATKSPLLPSQKPDAAKEFVPSETVVDAGGLKFTKNEADPAKRQQKLAEQDAVNRQASYYMAEYADLDQQALDQRKQLLQKSASATAAMAKEFDGTLQRFKQKEQELAQRRAMLEGMAGQDQEIRDSQGNLMDVVSYKQVQDQYNADAQAFVREAKALGIQQDILMDLARKGEMDRNAILRREHDIKAGIGNRPAGMAYSMLSSAGRTLSGTAELVEKVTPDLQDAIVRVAMERIGIMPKREGEYADYDFKQFLKDFESAPTSVTGIDQFVTPEYIQRRSDESLFDAGLFAVADMAPGIAASIAGGVPAMAATYFASSYRDMGNEMQGEYWDKVDPTEKEAIRMGVATVSAGLATMGLQGLAGRIPIVNEIFFRAAQKMLPNMTAGQVRRIIDAETKSYVTNLLSKGVQGVILEGPTEVVDFTAEEAVKHFYENYKRGEFGDKADTLFSNAETFDEFWEGAVKNYAVGSAAGSIMGGSLAAASSIGARKRLSDKEFEVFAKILGDGSLQRDFESQVAADLASGKIDRAEYDKLIDNLGTAKSIVEQIPDDMDIKATREAYDLLEEKANLKKKDKALVGDRIAKIDEKLAALAGTPVDKEAIVSDKATEKQAEPKAKEPTPDTPKTPPITPVPDQPKVEVEWEGEAVQPKQKADAATAGAEDIREPIVDTEQVGSDAQGVGGGIGQTDTGVLGADEETGQAVTPPDQVPPAGVQDERQEVATKPADSPVRLEAKPGEGAGTETDPYLSANGKFLVWKDDNDNIQSKQIVGKEAFKPRSARNLVKEIKAGDSTKVAAKKARERAEKEFMSKFGGTRKVQELPDANKKRVGKLINSADPMAMGPFGRALSSLPESKFTPSSIVKEIGGSRGRSLREGEINMGNYEKLYRDGRITEEAYKAIRLYGSDTGQSIEVAAERLALGEDGAGETMSEMDMRNALIEAIGQNFDNKMDIYDAIENYINEVGANLDPEERLQREHDRLLEQMARDAVEAGVTEQIVEEVETSIDQMTDDELDVLWEQYQQSKTNEEAEVRQEQPTAEAGTDTVPGKEEGTGPQEGAGQKEAGLTDEKIRELDRLTGLGDTEGPVEQKGSSIPKTGKELTDRTIRRAVKALAGLGIRLNVVAPKTREQYNEAVKAVGKDGVESAWGIYDPRTKTIYINPTGPDLRQTFFHETAHPILVALAQSDPDRFAKFADEVIDEQGGKYERFARENYGDQSEVQRAAEALAEFMGDVAAGRVPVSTKPDSLWQKFKAFLQDIMAMLGWDMRTVDLSKPDNVRKFAAEYAKAINKGIKITGLGKAEGVGDAMMQQDQAFDGPETPKTPIGDTKTVTVDGKERTVFNSNGKPIHPTVEGVRNFWKWFGDSKVVDEQGRPLVAHHGTRQGGFTEFDKNKIGTSTDSGWIGKGFYFTDDKVVATFYSTAPDPNVLKREVYEVYLRLSSPFYWGIKGYGTYGYIRSGEPLPADLQDVIYNKTGFKYDPYKQYETQQSMERLDNQVASIITSTLKERGHDGVIADFGKNDGFEFVVFDPTQIKSATGNYGTFDPANPNILLQKPDGSKLADTFKQQGLTAQQAKWYMESRGVDPDVIKAVVKAMGGVKSAPLKVQQQAKKATGQTQPPTPPTEKKSQKNDDQEVKKTFTTVRAYEGAFRQEVKEKLEKSGLYRSIENQEEAEASADKFIKDVGIAAALDAVRAGDVRGGAATVIRVRALEALDRAYMEASTQEDLEQVAIVMAELIEENSRVFLEAGQGSAMLSRMYANSDLGFYSAKKADEWRREFGEDPSPEMMAEWKKRDEELRDLRKQLDEAIKRAEEAEAKAAVDAIKQSVQRRRAKPKSNTEKAKELADQFRKLKARPMTFRDANGNVIEVKEMGMGWNELIELGAKTIEKTGQVVDALSAIAEKLKEQAWFAALAEKDRIAVMEQIEDHFRSVSEEDIDDRIRIPKAMIRAAVEAGANDIDTLVAVIKEQIKDDYPEATDREIRDAITEYGKVLNMSQDEISAKIRRMKDIGRTISAIEDVENKKRPLRSGLQRDKLDAEQRALKKKLRELMKELPVDEETQQRQLKTSLDAAKTRMRNRIEDMQREIEMRERVRKVNKTLEPDAELNDLKAQKDALQKQHDEIFKDKAITEEERLERAINGARRSLDEYRRRIAEKELDPKKPAPVQANEELNKLREQVQAAKAEYERLRDEAGVIDRKRLEAAKAMVNQRIKDLQRRIEEKDFSKKEPRKAVSDSELVALRAKQVRIRELYDKEFHKHKLSNRTMPEKVKDSIWELWGITRALQATGELSFILMQGGALTISNLWHKPSAVKAALRNMAAAMRSRRKADEWLDKVKAQEWYPAAKKAKLAITEPHAEMTAREEMFFSDWTSAIWKGLGSPLKLLGPKAYQKWVDANPWQMFERGAVAYLDTLRVERYMDGISMLEKNGITPTEQDLRDVADVVNTLTGRASLGRFETMKDTLSKLFFSPRLWSSAIKTATPYAFHQFGLLPMPQKNKETGKWEVVNSKNLSSTARKMAMQDMGRFVGTTMGFVLMAAAYANNDDDEETSVEFDPRSSDFLKIKIGNTRIDPWGGRIQQVVLTTKLAIGALSLFRDQPLMAHKNPKTGELYPLGLPFRSPTMFDAGLQMAMNKLAPSASLAVEAARTGLSKDPLTDEYTRINTFREEFDLSDKAKEKLIPIYWTTVQELAKEDPGAIEGFLMLYAFLGGGVNVYEPREKQPEKSAAQKRIDAFMLRKKRIEKASAIEDPKERDRALRSLIGKDAD